MDLNVYHTHVASTWSKPNYIQVQELYIHQDTHDHNDKKQAGVHTIRVVCVCKCVYSAAMLQQDLQGFSTQLTEGSDDKPQPMIQRLCCRMGIPFWSVTEQRVSMYLHDQQCNSCMLQYLLEAILTATSAELVLQHWSLAHVASPCL